MRRFVFAAAALAASLAAVAGAAAQPYPSRPITMIVPLATGGSTDVIARLMAEGMRAALGQPIIVENVTGAGGSSRARRPTATPSGSASGGPTWRAARSTRSSSTC
jgi:tripartite-type tricarboxylate transporter receptor subunit TctC